MLLYFLKKRSIKGKNKMTNFRGIVPIQSLISVKLSLKWALDEVSTTKLMFPYIMGNGKFCMFLSLNGRNFFSTDLWGPTNIFFYLAFLPAIVSLLFDLKVKQFSPRPLVTNPSYLVLALHREGRNKKFLSHHFWFFCFLIC